MRYIDGFLLVVPKKKLTAYRAVARKAGKVWMDHGALDYRECIGEDLATPCGVPFPKRAGAGRGDVVIFSWITYRSRAHRDRVNAAAMQDRRMQKLMTQPMPCDMRRMSHGGFDVIVDF